ncbi:CRISPR-associated protein Cas4 [Proteinivorax hydrogeniformans]|uniref:CRISPR-associated exonuclease Cas4 n=1 Tax=Proteinivorax hydrogeniformans TaxID=1826727 RepID=A0AAU8HW56_9FIRM
MKENNEENFLMLSGIQHFQFCKRQWALIHVEQQWEENIRTVEGNHIHRKVDQPLIKETRKNKLIIRSLPVQSKELGITGVCDVVEFIEDEYGISVLGSKKKYVPIPIEYKKGKPKTDKADTLQLAAQAMCLEEMLVCQIDKGYIFYNEIKRRVEVPLSGNYKTKIKDLVSEMHQYFNKGYTPKAKVGKHCNSCSLQNICLPKLLNKQTASSYIERKIKG